MSGSDVTTVHLRMRLLKDIQKGNIRHSMLIGKTKGKVFARQTYTPPDCLAGQNDEQAKNVKKTDR